MPDISPESFQKRSPKGYFGMTPEEYMMYVRCDKTGFALFRESVVKKTLGLSGSCYSGVSLGPPSTSPPPPSSASPHSSPALSPSPSPSITSSAPPFVSNALPIISYHQLQECKPGENEMVFEMNLRGRLANKSNASFNRRISPAKVFDLQKRYQAYTETELDRIEAEAKKLEDEVEKAKKEEAERERVRRAEEEEKEKRRREEEEEREARKREEVERARREEEEKEAARRKKEEEDMKRMTEEEGRRKNEDEEKKRREEKSQVYRKLCEEVLTCQKEYNSNYHLLHNLIINSKNGEKLKSALMEELKQLREAYDGIFAIIELCKKGEVKESDAVKCKGYCQLLSKVLSHAQKEADRLNEGLPGGRGPPGAMKTESRMEGEKAQKEDVLASTDVDLQMAMEEPEEAPPAKSEENKGDGLLGEYHRLKGVLEKTEQKLHQFMNDDSLKKFRADCRKAVNTPINAISAVSASHMVDKLERLSGLLSGGRVQLSDKSFTASSHPLGVLYCTYLVAKKFVNQGEQVVSSSPEAAFSLGGVAVELWSRQPSFGELMLAHLYRVCPYLVPSLRITRKPGQSDVEYNKELGFQYNLAGELEELNMFLKRMGGVVRFYCAMMVGRRGTTGSRGSPGPPPLSLASAWTLIASFLSQEPRPDISATLLFEVLEVTASSMESTYSNQFRKLLQVISTHYIPAIQKVTVEGRSGPVSRLSTFLSTISASPHIPPPKGLLRPNFW